MTAAVRLLSFVAALARRSVWRSLFATTGGVRITGPLPQGPCVIVANHSSHADAPALLAALPARLRPAVAAADDYWFHRPWRRRTCRALVGAFPVRRQGGGSADLEAAAALLRAGRSIVVLPEGTRSRTGEVARFRSGAFRLAATAGVPVVPVALLGTRDLMPVHGRPHRAPLTVRFGPPSPCSAPDPAADAEAARAAVTSMVELGPAPADSRLRRTVAAFADRPAALVLVAVWATAEAVSWPLVPEFVLGLLALAAVRWRRLAALTVAALAGTLVGSALAVSLAAAGAPAPAPLTTPRMHLVAAAQLHAEGVTGVRHQPWSGIPIKVYSVDAGRSGLHLGPFLAAVAVARGLRLLVVAVVIGTVARLVPRRGYLPVAGFAVVTFAAGLDRVVAHWS